MWVAIEEKKKYRKRAGLNEQKMIRNRLTFIDLNGIKVYKSVDYNEFTLL